MVGWSVAGARPHQSIPTVFSLPKAKYALRMAWYVGHCLQNFHGSLQRKIHAFREPFEELEDGSDESPKRKSDKAKEPEPLPEVHPDSHETSPQPVCEPAGGMQPPDEGARRSLRGQHSMD